MRVVLFENYLLFENWSETFERRGRIVMKTAVKCCEVSFERELIISMLWNKTVGQGDGKF